MPDKRVEVEPFQQDRYKRLVGIVHVDGINVNAELIRKGHVWEFRQYAQARREGVPTKPS